MYKVHKFTKITPLQIHQFIATNTTPQNLIIHRRLFYQNLNRKLGDAFANEKIKLS